MRDTVLEIVPLGDAPTENVADGVHELDGVIVLDTDEVGVCEVVYDGDEDLVPDDVCEPVPEGVFAAVDEGDAPELRVAEGVAVFDAEKK